MIDRCHLRLLPALLAVAAACGTSTPAAPAPKIPDGAVDVAWTDTGASRVAHEYYSGFNEPARLVIDNQATWAWAWARLYQTLLPVPATPTEDFDRFTVLVVGSGTHGTGGYDIRVTRVASFGDRLYVEVTSTAPGPHCFVTEAFTQPVDVVRIPKPNPTIVFVNRDVAPNC